MSRFRHCPTSPRSLPRPSRALAALGCAIGLLAGATTHAAQVRLTWRDNATNESGYKIERATGSSGSFSQIATTGPNVASHTDTTAANTTMYRYRLRAFNSAGNSPFSNTISVTTGSSSNTPPTISSIASRTIAVNGTTGAIAFTIGDAQTPASSLTLIRNASNTSLVPLSGITFGGSGANRTVTIKPAPNKTGWSTIWIKVSDGTLTSYRSFVLTVSQTSAANTAPTISAIANRTIGVNGSTGAIAFKIGDAQTPASSLKLIKNASNTALIPLGNITFGGSGANRTVTVRPASNRTGWSTVWIKVSDGELENYVRFVVNVVANVSTATLAGAAASADPNTPQYATIAAPGDTDASVRFGHVALDGDVEVTVKVTAVSGAGATSGGGLMLRSSLAADAACAGVHLSASGQVAFASRARHGAALALGATIPGRAPAWLRLIRNGDTVYAFASPDGVEWELVDFAPLDLPDTALVGTAAFADPSSGAARASFGPLAID